MTILVSSNAYDIKKYLVNDDSSDGLYLYASTVSSASIFKTTMGTSFCSSYILASLLVACPCKRKLTILLTTYQIPLSYYTISYYSEDYPAVKPPYSGVWIGSVIDLSTGKVLSKWVGSDEEETGDRPADEA
jgi:hypothetical protein